MKIKMKHKESGEPRLTAFRLYNSNNPSAEKNEFYYDGGAVLVENLFPGGAGEGKKARLSDYIRETRV